MELPTEKRRLLITSAALRRVHTVARLVDEHIGSGCECMGFLLGQAGSDIVDTVILAPGQRVTTASVIMDGQSVLAAGREIQALGKTVLGWWHSHGGLRNFHSGTDDNNTRDVLLQIAFANHLDLEQELLPQTTDGHSASLSFADGSESIEILGEQGIAQRLMDAHIRVRRRIAVGFAYSLVVNARGDEPHAELYTQQWCPGCHKTVYARLVVPVGVVPAAEDDQLVAEVKAKVTPAFLSPLAEAPALPAFLKPIGAAMNSALNLFSPRKEGGTC